MKYKLDIDGMSCQHCAAHVREALKDLGGKNISVDLADKCAYVELDTELGENSFRDAIDEAGYDLTGVIEL